MRKILILIAAAAVAAAPVVAQLPAEKQNELNAAGIQNWTPGQGKIEGAPAFARVSPKPAPAAPENTDTMTYDNGVLNALPTAFGQNYGNRFSLGTGGVALSTITLNNVQFFFMEDSTPDTGIFLQPSDPLNATSISARASVNVSGLANSGQSFTTPVLNVVPQTALATTGVFSNTFFMAAWCLNANTTFPVDNETIGLATSAGPAGLRGITASSGTGAVAFANQPFNALLRANVTSPNTVPVELMAFEVE